MKTTIFLSVLMLFLFTGCEKKYNLDDLSGFEFNYNTGGSEPLYYYTFKLMETGNLDVTLNRAGTVIHSVYSVDNSDIAEFKPFLVNLLNSKIKADYYVEPGQSSDIPGIGISVKSNLRQLTTTISGPAEPVLPLSLKNILTEVRALQAKYDTLSIF